MMVRCFGADVFYLREGATLEKRQYIQKREKSTLEKREKKKKKNTLEKRQYIQAVFIRSLGDLTARLIHLQPRLYHPACTIPGPPEFKLNKQQSMSESFVFCLMMSGV